MWLKKNKDGKPAGITGRDIHFLQGAVIVCLIALLYSDLRHGNLWSAAWISFCLGVSVSAVIFTIVQRLNMGMAKDIKVAQAVLDEAGELIARQVIGDQQTLIKLLTREDQSQMPPEERERTEARVQGLLEITELGYKALAAHDQRVKAKGGKR